MYFNLEGGDWGLRYCGVEQFFLRYFGYFTLEMWHFSTNLRLFSILDCIRDNPPRPPKLSKPFPVSDWTFPKKLTSRCNRTLQVLVSQSEKKVTYLFDYVVEIKIHLT